MSMRVKAILQPLTDKNIKLINKDGYYWAQGNCVMSNFGDTNTVIFCMCINHKEAKRVAKAINLLEYLEDN
jgi:hypothetical protein